MATISSTLKLMEQTTAPIQRTIDAMNRMVDTMETINRAADLPNMDNVFGGLRAEISLADHALDQFNVELRDTGQAAESVERASTGFGGLSRAIIVANQGLQLLTQGYQFVEHMSSYADEMVQVQARLNLINDGLQTQDDLQWMIYQSAQASRGVYQDTAGAVAKLGILAGDAFGSTGEIVAFSELLNKSFKVGGADMSEQIAGLHQLTQAMASGRLQGDEFRSIGENAPLIAQAIAEYMQIPMGALKELSSDGVITADIIKNAMFNASAEINEQFASIPVTFSDRMAQTANYALQAFDPVIDRFSGWLNSADGAVFFYNLQQGIDLAVVGVGNLMTMASATSDFFVNNWSTIEPILWGVGTAVAGLTTAYLIYKGVSFAVVTAESIKKAAMMISTGSTIAATTAQHGLNIALLACPVTWIVVGIVAVIAVIVALWNTNIDFKVGVIGIWNDILGFFDQVPIFFMGVGYGIADAFSYAKVTSMVILDSFVNGAIERINWLIDKVNEIPGVSIEAIGGVSFGAETALKEQINRAERAASLADAKISAAEKAAQRELQLTSDKATWRAEADAKRQQQLENEQKGTGETPYSYDVPPVTIAGGKLDKIGGEVDISNQSLEYLNDIAEIQALGTFDSYNTVAYDQMDDLRLNPKDADFMRSSANSNVNIYYLNYAGGVNVKNDIRQGQDWETIAQELREQSQSEIDSGISMMEEVVYSR